MKGRKDVPKSTQKKLFQEAQSKCMICVNDDVSVLEIHHMIPYAENPGHDPAHMLVLCSNCHAKADRGEIPREILYAAKNKSRRIIPFPTKKSSEGRIAVTGNGNITAGQDIHVSGDLNIKYPRVKGKSKPPTIIIPGTVGEDPRMYGYLTHLIERYNELKEWE